MFKILDEVCTPQRGTKFSAYVDLFAREDYTIGAGETKIVKLGVKLDIEKLKFAFFDYYSITESFDDFWNDLGDEYLKSHYLEVALRSSLGVKGLIIANGIGIIDLDYPDEIGLIVHNPTTNEKVFEYSQGNSEYGNFEIKKGDKVAQCTLKEHKGLLMGYESDVVRASGFGSTGKWNQKQ